jgi:hypothetical protein
LVEAGKYCQRGNGRDVDINRNWNIYWGRNILQKEEYPGKYPFSEKETRFLKKSIKSFNPKVFLSVHSGIHGLYTPFAFFKKGVDKKSEKHLYHIQKKYCPYCKVGPASKLLGYRSSGTSLDYMYKKMNIRYSYTWEIYDQTKEEFKKLALFLLNHFKNKYLNKWKSHINRSSFLETRVNSKVESRKIKSRDVRCLAMFNPLVKKKFESVTKNWVRAMKSFFKSFV